MYIWIGTTKLSECEISARRAPLIFYKRLRHETSSFSLTGHFSWKHRGPDSRCVFSTHQSRWSLNTSWIICTGCCINVSNLRAKRATKKSKWFQTIHNDSSIIFLKKTFFCSSRLKSVISDASKFWSGLKMILKIGRLLLWNCC